MLREYERVRLPDLTAEQGLALQASGAVSVTPARQGFEVSAAGLVGVASVAGLQVWVRPKVELQRLLYLLGYADDPGWREQDLPAIEEDDLVGAVAAVLCWHTRRALAGGVLQGYRHREEALLTVRGRIRASEQISRRFGLPVPVEVAYDDYDVDIAENQILRTALRRVLQLPALRGTVRQRAQHLYGLLEGASELPPGVLPEVQPTRLNQRYRPALALARLVLEQRSIEFGHGSAPGQAFLVSMHRVFERFLGTALREAFRRHGGATVEQHTTKLDTGGAIDVRPDVVWRRKGRVRAVIDAKYKSLAGLTGPSGDMYQALAYCVAHNLPRCWLVYAAGNETPCAYTLRHVDRTVHVAAIDLSGDVRSLHRSIDRLAGRVVAKS